MYYFLLNIYILLLVVLSFSEELIVGAIVASLAIGGLKIVLGAVMSTVVIVVLTLSVAVVVVVVIVEG